MPTLAETQAMFPDSHLPATSDEDGSIYANIQGHGIHGDAAAWGYNKRNVNIEDMQRLIHHQNRVSGWEV